MFGQPFVRASIEENPDHQPSRESMDWEYINAPIRGHSDDLADETYAPSTCIERGDEEEEDDADSEVEARSAVGNGDSESESESDTDSGSESDSDTDMDDAESVLPTVERNGHAGPSRAPALSRPNQNNRVQKPAANPAPRPPWVQRETPVKNPYLKKIADEAARRVALQKSARGRVVGAGKFGLRGVRR